MKKYLKTGILILTIILLIGAIAFYFRMNVYKVNFYNEGNLITSTETRRNRPMKAPASPEKEGYIFLGWYDEEGNIFDFKENVTKNMNLIAHWGEIVTE